MHRGLRSKQVDVFDASFDPEVVPSEDRRAAREAAEDGAFDQERCASVSPTRRTQRGLLPMRPVRHPLQATTRAPSPPLLSPHLIAATAAPLKRYAGDEHEGCLEDPLFLAARAFEPHWTTADYSAAAFASGGGGGSWWTDAESETMRQLVK